MVEQLDQLFLLSSWSWLLLVMPYKNDLEGRSIAVVGKVLLSIQLRDFWLHKRRNNKVKKVHKRYYLPSFK